MKKIFNRLVALALVASIQACLFNEVESQDQIEQKRLSSFMKATASIELSPVVDAKILSYVDWQGINYSASTDLSIGKWTKNGTPFAARALIRFDLSSLPDDATITSAQLSLFADPLSNQWNGQVQQGLAPGHSTLSGENSFKAVAITENWAPNSITWSSQPAIDESISVSFVSSGSENLKDYIDIDFTSFIQHQNQNPNYGMMLLLNNETHYRGLIFQSSENGQGPILTIEYEYEEVVEQSELCQTISEYNYAILDTLAWIDTLSKYHTPDNEVEISVVNEHKSRLNYTKDQVIWAAQQNQCDLRPFSPRTDICRYAKHMTQFINPYASGATVIYVYTGEGRDINDQPLVTPDYNNLRWNEDALNSILNTQECRERELVAIYDDLEYRGVTNTESTWDSDDYVNSSTPCQRGEGWLRGTRDTVHLAQILLSGNYNNAQSVSSVPTDINVYQNMEHQWETGITLAGCQEVDYQPQGTHCWLAQDIFNGMGVPQNPADRGPRDDILVYPSTTGFDDFWLYYALQDYLKSQTCQDQFLYQDYLAYQGTQANSSAQRQAKTQACIDAELAEASVSAQIQERQDYNDQFREGQIKPKRQQIKDLKSLTIPGLDRQALSQYKKNLRTHYRQEIQVLKAQVKEVKNQISLLKQNKKTLKTARVQACR